MWVHVGIHVCVWTCAHGFRLDDSLGCHPQTQCLSPLRPGLSLIWSSMLRLDCLVSEFQASFWLYFPGSGIASLCRQVFLYAFWASNPHPHACEASPFLSGRSPQPHITCPQICSLLWGSIPLLQFCLMVVKGYTENVAFQMDCKEWLRIFCTETVLVQEGEA